MANISVLGAGSWGLGLALLLNNNGHNVTVWSVLKDEVAMLQTERVLLLFLLLQHLHLSDTAVIL